MDDQQNRSIFYIHCRHMPTKSGKVTKGYKKKKTWAASRRAPGWKPAKQSKYFSTTIMGCAPLVIQTGSQADINGGQLQDQRASYSFSLNYLNNPDVAHYLAVFDEYCVTKIEVHQTPRSNQAAIINATEPPGGPNPTYWNAVTHVATECELQVSTPTNAIQVMQQDSYFNIEQTKAYKFSFKPRAIIVGQGQNGQIQTSAKPNTWISCQDGTALHSGLQWYADPCTTANLEPGGVPNAISWWIRFFISFRNT